MITISISMRAAGVALATALLATPLAAQAPVKSSFDRTVVPTAGPVPKITLPVWSKTTLSNGAQLDRVGEAHAAARLLLDGIHRGGVTSSIRRRRRAWPHSRRRC